MKITFRQRILIFLFIIFAVFTISIIYVEQLEEQKQRTVALEAKLDGYTNSIHSYIERNNLTKEDMLGINGFISYLPNNMRVSIIGLDGNVLYDKDVADVTKLENHMDRPEIMMARFQPFGTTIRMSESTHIEYYYYAKAYSDCFVRVALPYNIQTRSLLKADNAFIYIVIVLFIVFMILIAYVARRFTKSITTLRNFTSDVKNGKPLPKDIKFPHDELGEIGEQLVEIFHQKEKNQQDIEIEKEKLIRHFQYSGEGLGIFSSEFKTLYANTHFIQYLNLISKKPTFDADSIFYLEELKPAKDFLNQIHKEQNIFTLNINSHGKSFLVQLLQYEDKSFEISIRDVTKQEKTRLLKQEMTSNIAHELRTPITSLRGYLETLSENNLAQEKTKQFIDRAYVQSIRLSNLIEDVSLLSKIEESGNQFGKESIKLSQVITDARIDLSKKLETNNITLISTIKDDVVIHGNYTLLYSIFRNLIDNSITYGGKNIEIHIDVYLEDESYLYISFYDTGIGVEEHHLTRLFERFYRVDQGRTRETGGSGLGLSIVRNSILIHKGSIQAKNRIGGGLEFLFTLKK